MAKKILKYVFITLAALIILLAFTNPSTKQFKDFIGEPSIEDYAMTYKRTNNWLIFSTYEFSYTITYPGYKGTSVVNDPLDKLKGTYTGFFLNFYKK